MLDLKQKKETVRLIKCTHKNCSKDKTPSPKGEFSWLNWICNAKIWVAEAF